MKHTWIPRILALLLVIVVIVLCVLLAQPIRAVMCRLEGKPEPWEPDTEDVEYISRTIWGECRGCCDEEQRAQAWCILNRVDDPRFPDTVKAVVTAANQFQGYSPNNPVEPFRELAWEILILWNDGYREMPADMCWCEGKNGHQTFRDSWIVTAETEFYP